MIACQSNESNANHTKNSIWKSAVKSLVQTLASIMLSCGSARLSLLVLECLIMSLCYFALASGQVVESFGGTCRAKLQTKTKDSVLGQETQTSQVSGKHL